ncbi:MAG: helix-turn-helix domain-containing protein [Desulfobacteraceae bacterium]|nr:helix-turn-helix domain-containing protein [Desulfobacteraceae bacterium]
MDKIKKNSEQDGEKEIQQEVEALRIGSKMRRLRQRRNLTLQNVADLSGLSKSLLSQIENKNSVPPIATLLRISKALGVSIGYFFKESKAENFISYVPKNKRYRVQGLPHNRTQDLGYYYQALSRPIANQHMEPFWIEFNPRSKQDVEFYQHVGEEFIHLQQGRLEFQAGERTIVMEPGDSLYFNSSIAHAARSLNNQKASAIAVIYSPHD